VQAGWGSSDQLHLGPAELLKLESRNQEMGYSEILTHFNEPSQYFDGKHSLFMQATMVRGPLNMGISARASVVCKCLGTQLTVPKEFDATV
jgi:hypothetical protein